MPRTRRFDAARGFTLIELLIVVALIAIVSAIAGLALRDGSGTQLEREASRLSALLEAARAESRTVGLPITWAPVVNGEGVATGFHFSGTSQANPMPSEWLQPGVSVQMSNDRGLTRGIVLGPEPVIGPQRITLRLNDQQLTLSTDGLGPFTVATDETH
ncbi:MAG TPA: prepilin-type N-terminal cleavage/methylation domain-containing protein [Burkholderiaceae bacterium]|nr:prepilin-type N-terminal cleavage/methylation domain-containing protein [Burkholderiaceae bacterium]